MLVQRKKLNISWIGRLKLKLLRGPN